MCLIAPVNATPEIQAVTQLHQLHKVPHAWEQLWHSWGSFTVTEPYSFISAERRDKAIWYRLMIGDRETLNTGRQTFCALRLWVPYHEFYVPRQNVCTQTSIRSASELN